ncbi:MAG: cytochrome oxidase [Gemmatimonadetes bacterium]|nr:cytochrome oxidase [Gemmatimonadota bacterium]
MKREAEVPRSALHADPAEDARDLRRLERTWSPERGLWGWLTSVDHKSIARRYVATALVSFVLAGINALVMRVQLARPESHVLGPDAYNQYFTTHGTAMMFLFAVPIMEAVGIYFVPLMVGTRNVAFPRLNALGYWTFLVATIFLWASFYANVGPDAGWTAYVPLSGPQFSPGKRVDTWAQMITFTEVSALIGAVEIITTAFKQRAPGMSLNRIPLFVWAEVVTAFMILFAMSTIATASMMLAMDRLIGTHFFNPAEGGDALLWQHLFWFFGHPEVYIIFIPATGMVSAMLPAFTRRPVFGYTAIVLSLIGTGFIGFGLWVHHMFATAVPWLGSSFFTASSVMIAVPSGIQVLCWIATVWDGRPRLATPMLFILGFLVLFVIGGLTGVMIASVPFDLQMHDTFFVVAHFHYVLIGGAVFPLFGAFYYWFPKVTGRMLGERLGKWNFWLFFAGMNVTFFPMHFLGLLGMPRRVYTYSPDLGWGPLNMTATVGAFVIALSVLVFFANVARSLARGAPAGDDPWGADSLEWATASPPPPYNFRYPPVVQGRAALWSRTPDAPVVTGLRTDKPEILMTTLLDAEPESRHVHPQPTIWPLVTAIGLSVLLLSLIYTPWGLIWGAAAVSIGLIGWGWPDHHRGARLEERG